MCILHSYNEMSELPNKIVRIPFRYHCQSDVQSGRSWSYIDCRQLPGYWKIWIKTIAYESGFHNVDYFCRLFKKRYHLTPSDYRCACLKQYICKWLPDESTTIYQFAMKRWIRIMHEFIEKVVWYNGFFLLRWLYIIYKNCSCHVIVNRKFGR